MYFRNRNVLHADMDVITSFVCQKIKAACSRQQSAQFHKVNRVLWLDAIHTAINEEMFHKWHRNIIIHHSDRKLANERAR